jgi:glycosyltransferase involved in cell wall biosynthesis
MKKGVSIVICTYNGKDRLGNTLMHIARQKDINFDLEVLLVDNNSSDGTSESALNIWRELGDPFELKIILERRPGTMHARKRGINESTYRYMLYCDDDNWLNPNYVSVAFSIINSQDSIAAVGGLGIIEYEKGFKIPKWVAPYERNYGTGTQGKTDGDTTDYKGCLYTAGAILDRVWLDKLYRMGFVSSLTGRIGKSLVAGEDTELTYALKLIGGKLYYSSKMHFQHFMPSSRITWNYLKRLYRAFGYAEYIISPYPDYFSKKKYPHRILSLGTNFKSLVSLYLRRVKKGTLTGDPISLSIQRKQGELHAIIFNYNQFKSNIKMIERLKSHTSVGK